MSEKSEMQKHLDGELFWNSDPEISAAKSRARALCDEYNLTKENQPRERLRLLKEIFGSCDDDIFIKPPFHCDYGYNIHVGKRFFANFDVVILDTAKVTIGDNCLIGPQTGLVCGQKKRHVPCPVLQMLWFGVLPCCLLYTSRCV